MNRGMTRVSARFTCRIFKEPGTRCGADIHGTGVYTRFGWPPVRAKLANYIPRNLADALLVKGCRLSFSDSQAPEWPKTPLHAA